jgi:hypothetical protein
VKVLNLAVYWELLNGTKTKNAVIFTRYSPELE